MIITYLLDARCAYFAFGLCNCLYFEQLLRLLCALRQKIRLLVEHRDRGGRCAAIRTLTDVRRYVRCVEREGRRSVVAAAAARQRGRWRKHCRLSDGRRHIGGRKQLLELNVFRLQVAAAACRLLKRVPPIWQKIQRRLNRHVGGGRRRELKRRRRGRRRLRVDGVEDVVRLGPRLIGHNHPLEVICIYLRRLLLGAAAAVVIAEQKMLHKARAHIADRRTSRLAPLDRRSPTRRRWTAPSNSGSKEAERETRGDERKPAVIVVVASTNDCRPPPLTIQNVYAVAIAPFIVTFGRRRAGRNRGGSEALARAKRSACALRAPTRVHWRSLSARVRRATNCVVD